MTLSYFLLNIFSINTLIIKVFILKGKKGKSLKLPQLKIGNLIATVPIIQGGMGIGVSLNNLAAAVAKEGGIGIISGVQIGFNEPDFIKDSLKANIRALKREIRLAREKCKKGIIGVNIMTAVNHYKELVTAAVEEGIDLIVSGAGLPMELPELVKETKVKIAPIVSSGKAISVICKMWERKHSRMPDLVVVEGPEAGGHLGFHKDDLSLEPQKIENIFQDVKKALMPYEEKYNSHIPVVVAGGIFSGEDIAKFMDLGADGVQMATRFIATVECDAHENYKRAYVNAKKEDIQIVVSPVGMPGRAIRNNFIKSLEEGPKKVRCINNCLKPCNPQNTPYCISQALINARNGDIDEGLLFCGSSVDKIDKIVTVKELINELVGDCCQARDK